MAGVREKAERAAEERILDALLPVRKKRQTNPFGLFQDNSELMDDSDESFPGKG
jgi:ATP-dependent protease HslVU (ClpYQ) ATPase subunit